MLSDAAAAKEGTMCLSKAFLIKNGKEQLILDSVCNVRMENGEIVLYDIIGETSSVRGIIQDVDLIRNTILIRAAETPETVGRRKK